MIFVAIAALAFAPILAIAWCEAGMRRRELSRLREHVPNRDELMLEAEREVEELLDPTRRLKALERQPREELGRFVAPVFAGDVLYDTVLRVECQIAQVNGRQIILDSGRRISLGEIRANGRWQLCR